MRLDAGALNFLRDLEKRVQDLTDYPTQLAWEPGKILFLDHNGEEVLTIQPGDSPRKDKTPDPWFKIGPCLENGVPTNEVRRIWNGLTQGFTGKKFDMVRRLLGMQVPKGAEFIEISIGEYVPMKQEV